MRRKIAAVLLAVLMILPAASAPVLAADPVYFTAVNETILELSDATMPFWSGGYLYVSSTLFSNKELGVYYSPNSAKQTLVLYTNRLALIFDLSNMTTTDSQGNFYSQKAIAKGSDFFLPISMVALFFNLTYTNSKVTNGYLIRVKSGGAVLSDAMFIDAAASQMEYRYSQYQKRLEPPTEPTIPTQPEDNTPGISGKSVYLCFLADDSDEISALLDVLDHYDCRATFYFTPELLPQAGDLLRRMTATGQGIGLIADAAQTGTPPAERLNAGNQILFESCSGKTRLAFLKNAGQQDEKAAEAAGYCCFVPTLDRSAVGLRTTGNASTLLKRVTAKDGEVSVWLSNQVSASGLKAFLINALAADDRCLSLTETSA